MGERIKTFVLSRKGFLIIWLIAMICLIVGQFKTQSIFTPIGMGLLLMEACGSLFFSVLEEEKRIKIETSRQINSSIKFY